MPTRSIITVIVICLCAAHAMAQMPARVFPTTTLWQNQPANVANDPRFAAMQSLNVHVAADYHPHQNNPTPQNAAILLCTQIASNFAAGRVVDGNVCVVLRGFGHDWFQSQPGWVDPPGNDPCLPQGEFLMDLGFFTPTVDALPGIGIDLFPQPPNPFPLSFPMQCGDNQSLDARPWRHPFMLNTTTEESPLRNWMRAFVTKIDEIVSANPSQYPDPANWKWFFDTEPFAYWVGSQNGTYIPFRLAQGWNQTESIWNKWKVPGSPGWSAPQDSELRNPGTSQGFSSAQGKTLAEMWYTARGLYGLPENPTLAFNIGQRADHEDNRAGMLWWMTIWHHAADAVMNNTAYSVIRDKWPTAKCGNWDMSSVDGEIDTTPWYVDWNQTPHQQSDELRRCIIDPSPAVHAPPLTRHPNHGTNYMLWASHVQHSSGTHDCPIFYPLNSVQLDGNPSINQFGHRQLDLFRDLGYGAEEEMVTTLRLNRHAAESIINSYGGGRQTRLAPWIPQYIGDPWNLPNDPIPYFSDERDQRALLAMLRAKNVGELITWTAATTLPSQDTAWRHTADVVKRVYAGSVTSIKIVHGEVAGGAPPLDPSMLEFALRDEQGEDFTADITIQTSTVPRSVIHVTLDGFADVPPPPDFACSQSDQMMGFDIFVEGWAKNAPIENSGAIYILNPWTLDEVLVGTYSIPTPDGRFRHRVVLDPCVDLRNLYLNSSGAIVLALTHNSVPAGTLCSKYDLVQVIPFWQCPCSAWEDESDSISPADVNYDGMVDAQDLILFVDAWAEGRHLADVNLDGQVDETDVDAFITDYSTSP